MSVLYYYDGFIAKWYPKNADGSYVYGPPQYYYDDFLKMPSRLYDSNRAVWMRVSEMDRVRMRDTMDLPFKNWVATWMFDPVTGNLSLPDLPVIPEFPKRVTAWNFGMRNKPYLNSLLDFASLPSNPGIGYAGELVIKDKTGKEYVFDFTYESMYSSDELRGDFIYVIVDGKKAVCPIDYSYAPNRVWIGFNGMHI